MIQPVVLASGWHAGQAGGLLGLGVSTLPDLVGYGQPHRGQYVWAAVTRPCYPYRSDVWPPPSTC
ncbi:MAG: hypothetical protein GX605_06780 [Chloroflexi bacterium]|nr:hypothetical protein [Chloroflexota bacterium]